MIRTLWRSLGVLLLALQLIAAPITLLLTDGAQAASGNVLQFLPPQGPLTYEQFGIPGTYTYVAPVAPAAPVSPAVQATAVGVIGNGGLLVPFPTVWATASFNSTTPGGKANSITRRSIIKPDGCNSCHSNLGAFTTTTFHSAGNNDPQSCAICHNSTAGHDPNGYGINAKDWIHGLHSAGFRNYPYVVQSNFPAIQYPGLLNNCEACHVPGSYDFSNSTNYSQIPNMLWDTNAVGTATQAATVGTTTTTTATNFATITFPAATNVNQQISLFGSPQLPTLTAGQSYLAPWTATNTVYGQGFTTPSATSVGITLANTAWSVTKAGKTTVTPTATVGTAGIAQPFIQPQANTLVTSPLTAACAGCHDSPTAINHMTLTGGGAHFTLRSALNPAAATVNGVATTSIAATEQCLICHGAGGIADIRTVHMNF